MAFLDKEHLTQGAGLLVTIGAIIAGASVWIVDRVEAVAAVDRAAAQVMDHRVTTLEVNQQGLIRAIGQLSSSVDQYRSATADLSITVTKLSQVIDDLHPRR